MSKSSVEMLFDLTNDILNEYMELGIILTEKCWNNDPAFKEIFDKTYDMFAERFDNIWDIIHYPGLDEDGDYHAQGKAMSVLPEPRAGRRNAG